VLRYGGPAFIAHIVGGDDDAAYTGLPIWT
jgi:hypothetical protein